MRLRFPAFLLAVTLSGTVALNSQPIVDDEGDVGIGSLTTEPSAILELVTTDKGFLVPRMSQAQRDAIPAPADALMIFNTTTSEFNFWDPSTGQWEVFISSSNVMDYAWVLEGNNLDVAVDPALRSAYNGATGAFLGTTSADDAVIATVQPQDIEFWTAATQRAILDATGNFYPATDNSYTLGTDAMRWADAYVNGGSVHIGPSGGEAGNTEMNLGYAAGVGTIDIDGGVDEIGISTVATNINNNLDANQGVDVFNQNLTVGGTNFVVDVATGAVDAPNGGHDFGTAGVDAQVMLVEGDPFNVGNYELIVDGDVQITGLLALPALTPNSVLYTDAGGNVSTDNPPFSYDEGTNTMTTENLVVTTLGDFQGTVENTTGNLTLDDATDVTGVLDAQSTIVNTTAATPVTVDDDLLVNNTTTMVEEFDAQDFGNTVGDGTDQQQLVVEGDPGAIIGNTLAANPPEWDLVVIGDQVTTGLIKAGGSIYIDGFTPGNHQIVATDELNVGTIGANDLTLSTNATTAVTIDGTTQDVDIANNANVGGTLNVVGATTLQSTLDVDGITNLNSNLNVFGPTDLNSTLNVDGAVTINNTINQTGGGQVTFSGNVDATSGLDVSGQDLTVASGVSVEAPGSGHTFGTLNTDAQVVEILGDNFNVGQYELFVDGDVQITGLLSLPGLGTNAVVYTDGAGNLSTDNPPFAYDDVTNTVTTENLVVTGTSDLQGAVSNTTANNGGDVFIDDDANVTGSLDVDTDLNTDGNTTLNGNVDLGDANTDLITFVGEVDSDIIPDVDNTYSLGSNTNRWADVFVEGASVHIGSDLATEMNLGYAAGTGTLNVDQGAVEVEITTAATDVNNNLDANAGVDVTGGDLTVGGTNFTVDDLTGNTDVAGTLTADGNTTLGDDAAADLHTVNGQVIHNESLAGDALTINESGDGNALEINESGPGDAIRINESDGGNGLDVTVSGASGRGLAIDQQGDAGGARISINNALNSADALVLETSGTGRGLFVNSGDAEFDENVQVDGNTLLNGDVDLGDAAADAVTLNGTLTGAGSGHSLGTAAVDANVLSILGDPFNVGNYELRVDGDVQITGLLSLTGLTGNSIIVTDAAGNLITDNPPLGYDATTDVMTAPDIVPSADNTYTLGTDATRWAEVYVNGASVHIGPSGGEAGNTEMSVGYAANEGTINVNGGAAEIEIDAAAGITRFDPDGDGTLNAFVRGDGVGINTGIGTDILITQDGIQRNGGAVETFAFSNTGGDLDVNVQGDLDVDNDLNVDGNTVHVGTLDQQGAISSSTGDVVINDDANVTGSLDVDTDLNVDGATTHVGTLDQQGAVSNSTGDVVINDDANVTGSLDVDTDLNVDGATTHVGTLDQQGAVSNSTGDVVINDDANVTGSLDVDTDLNVDGNTTHVGTLDQQGAVSNSTGDVVVNDDANVTGSLDVDTDLNVDGATTHVGTLDQQGAVSNSTGDVVINDDANLTGSLDVDTDLNVDGATTHVGTLDQQGAVSNSTGDVVVNDDANVTGSLDVDTDLNVDGATTHVGTLDQQGAVSNSTGDVVINDDANVTGSLDVDTDLNVDGATTLVGAVDAQAAGNVVGDGTDAEQLQVDGVDGGAVEVDINGDADVSGTLTAGTLNLGLTQGSVPFADATGALTEDNTNLFWDDVNDRLGIGNNAPTVALDVTGNIEATGTIQSGASIIIDGTTPGAHNITTSGAEDLTIAPGGGDLVVIGSIDARGIIQNSIGNVVVQDQLNVNNGLVVIGGINASTNGITNAGAISGATTITASGLITGGSFSGDGALLSNLNASNIATGTLADARLSGNVPLLNAANAFTATNSFPATAAQGDAFITSINAGTAGSINATLIGAGLTDAQVNDNLTISGGTVDNTVIGGTTAAAATVTTLEASSATVTGLAGGGNQSLYVDNTGAVLASNATAAQNATGLFSGSVTVAAPNAGGTEAIADANVTATSIIVYSRVSPAGPQLSSHITAQTAGVGFTVQFSGPVAAGDVINYTIINP